MAKQRIVIRHRWALGDTVLMTGLVRDIHRAYPDKYEIKVDTNWTNVWWNNPYVTKFEEAGLPRPLKVTVEWGDAIKWNSYAKYGGRREMKHILAWYHYDFTKKTGIEVPVTDPRPDLHLDAEERKRRIQGRYWIIISGGKTDMTTKHWHAHRHQEVVDKLAMQGIHCVQVGAVHSSHIHPPLRGVTNMVGKTENVRDLWNMILHADGVICGVTGAMHIAAAFEKPCVVHAGGREEPWFEAYTNSFQAFGKDANPVKVEHKFLHTIGLLECCDVQGCWKKRTVPLDPADLTKKSYQMCRQPIRPEGSHAVPKCQDLILSDHIVEAVMEYYEKGVLPPIGTPTGKYSSQNPEFKPETSGITVPRVQLIKVTPDTVKEASPSVSGPEESVTTKGPIEVIREPSVDIRTQKPYQQVHPYEVKREKSPTIQRKLECMDDPIIGGKLTVFVLCYGPYTELARKCLSSLLASVPAERLDIRVATNQAAQSTIDYLRTLPITKLYINSENRHKYPVMREMFYDEQRPIETNYFLWLDDDTWVVKPQWINDLCQNIINNHYYNFRCYGNLMYHDMKHYAKNGGRPDQWFKSAKWYRGKHFRNRGGQVESPNGSVIDFAVGWCWAMETDAMRKADIPCRRLGHNGGDITIGEQLHQAGYGIKQWNRGKSLIACPAREQGGRRGHSERFPWDPER